MLGEIGYVKPDVWPIICKYDAVPWYNQSRFAGKNLVISSNRLDQEYEPLLETTITPVDFEPPYMPSAQEQAALTDTAEFLARKPDDWDKFPADMGNNIALGLSKMTGKPADSWENIFQTWTAVHANFVHPTYRADERFLNAPYSIGETFTISSCCVELFNLLDSDEKALLVRPCTGAMIVKALEKNQYYFVRIIKNA